MRPAGTLQRASSQSAGVTAAEGAGCPAGPNRESSSAAGAEATAGANARFSCNFPEMPKCPCEVFTFVPCPFVCYPIVLKLKGQDFFFNFFFS